MDESQEVTQSDLDELEAVTYVDDVVPQPLTWEQYQEIREYYGVQQPSDYVRDPGSPHVNGYLDHLSDIIARDQDRGIDI